MRLQSKFAILDVMRGRVGLLKRLKPSDAKPVEVVIHGRIEDEFGSDDGVSQEFNVIVDRVEVLD